MTKSGSISHYSYAPSSTRSKYKEQSKVDDMLENMYNTYTLTTGANYLP